MLLLVSSSSLHLCVRATPSHMCPRVCPVHRADKPDTQKLDIPFNRNMTYWVEDRLKQRENVEEMGLSEDWLR